MRKPSMWFPNRSNTNQAVQAQKMTRGWKFWIQKVEELCYLCRESKGADQLCSYTATLQLYCKYQLRSYCKADLHQSFVFSYAICLFAHEVALFFFQMTSNNVNRCLIVKTPEYNYIQYFQLDCTKCAHSHACHICGIVF